MNPENRASQKSDRQLKNQNDRKKGRSQTLKGKEPGIAQKDIQVQNRNTRKTEILNNEGYRTK